MDDEEIGYGKPPKSGRFRPGVSGNPKGRPKRKPNSLAESVKNALNRPLKYRERGQIKVATFREVSLTMLVDKATGGDIEAAILILRIQAHAERHGDAGADEILVENWMPDYAGQTAKQKTRDFAGSRDADGADTRSFSKH
jgi:Family of unknown function (DUF5681)